MDNFVASQIQTFIIFILIGIIIALIFDFFRILRKSFYTPDWLTYVEDILFWIITCIILAFSIYKYNNGEIRFYMFIGVIIGAILYIISLSKYIVKIFVCIIKKIKDWINLIVYYLFLPIKLIGKIIKRIIFKPINFVFINFKLIFANFLQKKSKKSAKNQ